MSNIVIQTRPTTLNDIVGLESAKRIILYNMEGSKRLGQALPSFLLAGPAGTGKTTLAECIALLSKRPNGDMAEVIKVLASDIKDPEDLINIANQVRDGDIIYFEEAHSLGGGGRKSSIVQATLLEWIEHFRLLNAGAANMIDAPKVSFIFPTTNPGRLSSALRSRCQTIHLSYYTIDELMEILDRAGKKFDLDLRGNPLALRLLAQSSRGTPRTAIMHRLDMLRKVMVVDNKPYDINTVKDMLKVHDINDWGLESNDIVYCNKLYELMNQNGHKPVGKKTMQQVTGFSDDMIDYMIEAYLIQIGAISIQHKGRCLTPLGFQILNKKPIIVNNIGHSKTVDIEKLRKLVLSEDVRKSGMKGIAAEFGLTYGPDNEILRNALRTIGYTVKQRAGIVPIS